MRRWPNEESPTCAGLGSGYSATVIEVAQRRKVGGVAIAISFGRDVDTVREGEGGRMGAEL